MKLNSLNINKIQEILIKLKIFYMIKNWYVLLAEYFGLLHSLEYQIQVNTGITLKLRTNTTDKWSVHEIILRDDYHLNDLVGVKNPTIVDLGANAGVFSVYAASKYFDAQIFAYEPETVNYSLLKKNINLNNMQKRVHPFHLACAQKTGVAFLQMSSDIRSHSIINSMNNNKVKINTTTLEDIFKTNKIEHIDLLKIDIEGSEYEILYNLPKKLFKKISRISMEYHNLDNANNNGIYLKKHLKNNNFILEYFEIIKNNLGFIYAKNK